MPQRQVVGNYFVSYGRLKEHPRSLRQEGCRLLIQKLHTNALEYTIDLSTVSSIEKREEEGLLSVVLCWLDSNVSLSLSGATKIDTLALYHNLLAWAKYFSYDEVLDCTSPRQPRKGELRGILLTPSRQGAYVKVWATQHNSDILSWNRMTDQKELLGTLDMNSVTSIRFDRHTLSFALFIGDKAHEFWCEHEESFIYWQTGALLYCSKPHQSQKSKVTSETVTLNLHNYSN